MLDAGSEIIDVHLVFVEEMIGCVSGGEGEGSLEAHKSRDSLLLIAVQEAQKTQV